MEGSLNSRLTALGNQLVEVHIWLREELENLRDNLDDYLSGRGERPANLRAHCLTFCEAVSEHHTSEDGDTFPALAEQYPHLRPALAALTRDHHFVAGILRNIEQLLAGVAADPEPAEAQRIQGELEGLAALLESHFAYEERQLVAVLNSLAPS